MENIFGGADDASKNVYTKRGNTKCGWEGDVESATGRVKLKIPPAWLRMYALFIPYACFVIFIP